MSRMMRDLLAELAAAPDVVSTNERRAAVKALEAEAAKANQDPVKTAAAAKMGMKYAEIADVEKGRNKSIIVTTFDGRQLIIVHPDHPDAEGKSGVMMRHPTRSWITNKGFPVYAEQAPPPTPDPEPTGMSDEDRDLAQYDGDDPTAALLRSKLDDIEERLRGVADDSMGQQAIQGEKNKVEGHLRQRRRELKAEWFEATPPGPDADEIAVTTAGYLWAKAILADEPERAAAIRAANLKVLLRAQPEMAPRELWACEKWFQARGIDLPDDGIDLPDDEPAPVRRRRRRAKAAA